MEGSAPDCFTGDTMGHCTLPLDPYMWFDELSASEKWNLQYPLILFQQRNVSGCLFSMAMHHTRLCNFGYTFLLESLLGIGLFLMASACLVRLHRSFPHRQHIQKVMFLMMMVVGLVRGILNAFASAKVQQLTTLFNLAFSTEGQALTRWFLETTVPVNSFSDLVVAYIDFMITSFWLRVHFYKVMTPLVTKVGLMLLFTTATIAFSILVRQDYLAVMELEFNNGGIYFQTITFMGVLFLLFALTHFVVVGLLFRSLCVGGFRNSHPLRRNVLLLGLAGLVCAVCLLFRGITLIGRVSRIDIFFTGALSFDSAVFTTVYFVVLMNVPLYLVVVTYGVMVFRWNIHEASDLHPMDELSDAAWDEARDLLGSEANRSVNLMLPSSAAVTPSRKIASSWSVRVRSPSAILSSRNTSFPARGATSVHPPTSPE